MIRWTSNSWSFLLYHLFTHIRFWPVALQFFVPTPSSGLDFARIVSHSSQSSANTNTGFRKKQDHPSLHHTTSCFGGTEKANQLQLQNMNKKTWSTPQTPCTSPPPPKKTSYCNLTYSVTPHTHPTPKKKGQFQLLKRAAMDLGISTTSPTPFEGSKVLEDHLLQAVNDRFEAHSLKADRNHRTVRWDFFGAQLLKLASCLLVGRIWKLPLSVSSWKKKR